MKVSVQLIFQNFDGALDDAEHVVVDQEALSQLAVGAHPEPAQPPQARLPRLVHQWKTRAALASTVRSRSS